MPVILRITVQGKASTSLPDVPDFHLVQKEFALAFDTGMTFPITLSGTAELMVDFGTTVLNAVELIGLKGRPTNEANVRVGPTTDVYMAAVGSESGFVFNPVNWIGASVGRLYFRNVSSATTVVDVYAWGS